MKHTISYKILSSLLAVLVIFSSLSFSIEKHFCEGEINSSLFYNAEELCVMESSECHKEGAKTTCCSSNIAASDCCINTSEFIKGIDIEQQAQTEQIIGLYPVFFLISDHFSNLSILKTIRLFRVELIIPPPKIPDFRVLFQVFRI